jgi:hypothetical protein
MYDGNQNTSTRYSLGQVWYSEYLCKVFFSFWMDGKNGKYLLACAEALFWKKKRPIIEKSLII